MDGAIEGDPARPESVFFGKFGLHEEAARGRRANGCVCEEVFHSDDATSDPATLALASGERLLPDIPNIPRMEKRKNCFT